MRYLSYIYKYPKIFAILAGALANLALAPFYIVPVLFISFPIFIKILDNSKKPFWIGWCFGFGYFVFGLYWIANSLLVDAEQFAWLVPFAISGIPAVAAIYIGLVAVVYKKLSPQNHLLKILLLASLWVLAEFARSYFPFGGFPWNLIGYAGLFSLYFSQLAWLGGVYALSFVVIIISCLPLLWKKWASGGAVIFLAVSIFGFGYFHTNYSGKEKIGLKIKIIQPNIKQEMKWEESTKIQNYVKTLEMAKVWREFKKPDLIILPESGVPYHLNRQPEALALAAEIIPKDSFLITGALRSVGNNEQEYKAWNTLYVLGSEGKILDFYDKHHLVPFGEYVPFRDILPIEKIAHGIGDFSRGEVPKTMAIKGKKFLPLICYEVIFPRYSDISESYDFIVNITNDAWFGSSTGPYQHLAAAQMRAIEQGVPVIRVANSGVSAIIKSSGELAFDIGLNKDGTISSDIPEKMSHKSIYSRYNNLPILLLIFFIVFFVRLKRKTS